jgi:hypothetical protein
VSLPASTIVIVLARHRGEHIEQHTVDGREHAGGESSAASAAMVHDVGKSSTTTRILRADSSALRRSHRPK